MNLQEAIDAPAWHSEHFPISFWPRTARPGVLVLENRVPKASIDELKKARGISSRSVRGWSEGRLTAAFARRPAPPRRSQPRAACRATRPGDSLLEGCMAMTWSIIARDKATGSFGIAVATKFFAAGARVPFIAAGVGAIATQALVNPFYGTKGLQLLRRRDDRGRDRQNA